MGARHVIVRTDRQLNLKTAANLEAQWDGQGIRTLDDFLESGVEDAGLKGRWRIVTMTSEVRPTSGDVRGAVVSYAFLLERVE